MGATDLFAQASILNLYDPDRSTTLTNMGELRSWGDFALAVNSKINDKDGLKAQAGRGTALPYRRDQLRRRLAGR